MKELNPRDLELVAIGAAIASNCLPCIEYHIPEARKAGLTDAQIVEAVLLADKIKQVPARKVLDAAKIFLGSAQTEGNDPDGELSRSLVDSARACCA